MSRLALFLLVVLVACTPATLRAADPSTPVRVAPRAEPLEALVWTSKPHLPTDPLPLVVLLHGRGGSPEGLLPVVQFRDLDIRVLALRGPVSLGQGAAWAEDPSPGAPLGSRADEGRRTIERAAASIAWLVDAGLVVGKPVVVGFSQGGFVAYGLALAHPDELSLVVPIGGFFPVEFIPEGASPALRALPVRALHGGADDVVPVSASRSVVDVLRARGVDATIQVFPGVPHRVSPEQRARLHDLVVEALRAR